MLFINRENTTNAIRKIYFQSRNLSLLNGQIAGRNKLGYLICKVIGIELFTVLQADQEVVEKSNLAVAGEPGLRVYDEGKDND